MKKIMITSLLTATIMSAQAERETLILNNDWTFHLGDAASMQKDFTHGTEYFTYFSKAVGQNAGPANVEFNDSAWQYVSIPHDWAVDLPYGGQESHSHGYKQLGWRHPENSIGWYRKHFSVKSDDEGKAITVKFEGIFRNAQIFCNGFYLGQEPSGYATQEYNLSEYLNYGGDNVLAVRCDAMTEEGWFYEGAGIYRNVYLIKKDGEQQIDNVFYKWDGEKISIKVETKGEYKNRLIDAEGTVVAEGLDELTISNPHLWNLDDPYLYTLQTSTQSGNDTETTKVGLRTIEYDVDRGLLLNGKEIIMKGSNLHLDHAGVGVALPKDLWIYRVNKLKEIGMNAIRCSHNPATPEMLDVCDSLGVLVIDENRLMGTNQEHLDLLRRMIVRDRNHPCVALWSIGNEEWWIEGNDKGEKIARTMIDYARTIDDSRLYTYGCSGGYGVVKQVDIHGYNYIVQNDVENRHRNHPDWFVIGTEETSGCGTRNVYETDSVRGWMKSINYEGEKRSQGEKNVIERGWKFYRDNAWAGGIFYWTGFDYRGEPNPMVWPATGSQFGILDYCGFPKDEAFYLKAAWTEEPVLHIFPHWNLKGWEGREVEVWAYTNMDEVELLQDGKSLGRQKIDKDGHLVWKTIYRPGKIVANGYRNGKKIITKKVETTQDASNIQIVTNKQTINTGSQDVIVADISLIDKKGRFVPNACDKITIAVNGPAEIIGWGNGDPGHKAVERPQGEDMQHMEISAFMGNAQILLRSAGDKVEPGVITVSATISGQTTAINIMAK